MENRFCLYCNKRLRPFRAYLALDWETRKYHKKCYKEYKLEKFSEEILRNNLYKNN